MDPWGATSAIMRAVIARLTRADEAALRALLSADPVGNVFPASVLEERGLSSGTAVFYGLRSGGDLRAAVAVVGRARLAVPIGGAPDEQRELGAAIRGKFRLAMGKRDLVDALWASGGDREPWLHRAHRLYRITAEEMGPWTAPTLRQATLADLPTVLRNAAAMQLEEMGRDPLANDPDAFRDRVAARIEAGRTYVLEEEGEIAFQVSLPSVGWLGGQIEGVYTHPVYRGLGIASQGLGQLCRTQLARVPRLTLTVDETNREATALYRKLGFIADQPFRLIRAD